MKAAEGMRLMINDGILRREPVLFCGILDRFLIDQKQEADAETNHSQYSSLLPKYDLPTHPTQMGDVCIGDVRPALVQDWLRKLVLSPKYKGHIRSLVYRLFDKAMLWELLNVERNPMDLVEVKGISKRKKRPRVLQVKDAWQILDALVQPFRTIALIGLCWHEDLLNLPAPDLIESPLWLAYYPFKKGTARIDALVNRISPPVPPPWGDSTNWWIHQYQGDATGLPGFAPGNVDMNRFNPMTRGAMGDRVRWLQRRLGTAQNGSFDATTETALRAFQSRNGLAASATVDPRTFAQLCWSNP